MAITSARLLGLIKAADEIGAEAGRLVSELRLTRDGRREFGAAWHHIAMEHFHAMIGAMRSGYMASATAMFRLQYECLLRGIWITKVASNEDIKRFVADDRLPHAKTMAEGISALDGTELWLKFHETHYGPLSGLTHGGLAAIARRFDKGNIGATYEEDFLVEALEFSSKMLLSSTAELAALCHENDVQEKLSVLFDAIENARK